MLQFDIRNTVEDQLLEDVRVECDIVQGADLFSNDAEPIYIPAPTAAFEKNAVAYVAYPLNKTAALSEPTVLECVLKFIVKEVDPDDGTVDEFDEGENEEWDLERLTIRPLDFVVGLEVASFGPAWKDLESAESTKAKINIAVGDIADVLPPVVAASGLSVCGGTDHVEDGASTHMFQLSGVAVGTHKIMALAQLVKGKTESSGALKIHIRSTHAGVMQAVLRALRSM